MQQRKNRNKMTINMRIPISKITCSCKHKRCKTNKIKIMMTKKVINNCSEDRREGTQ